MTNSLKSFLAVILIALCCLTIVQPPSGAETTTGQPMLLDHSYIVEHTTFLKEQNSSISFPKILILYFILALSLIFHRFKMKRYVFSFIPILKHIFLLFPIKFESRYIVYVPFHVKTK